MSPPPRMTGSIILLNGTSSAGKSTLANAVQDVMDAPYLSLGIDCFFEALPQRYRARLAPEVVPPPQADEGVVWVCTEPGGHGFRELRVGPVGQRLWSGMRHAAGALARRGNHVILDDVILANPFGPPAQEWTEVEHTLERGLAQLREGKPVRLERISEYETPALAYIASSAAAHHLGAEVPSFAAKVRASTPLAGTAAVRYAAVMARSLDQDDNRNRLRRRGGCRSIGPRRVSSPGTRPSHT